MDKVKSKNSGMIQKYDSYEDYKQGKAPAEKTRFGDGVKEDQTVDNEKQDKGE